MAKVVTKYKKLYDDECSKMKKHWDSKKKAWVQSKPKEGYVSKAVREHFKNLKDLPSSDPKFQKAVQFARRSHFKFEDCDSNKSEFIGEPSKKRFRAEGAGRRAQAPEFRDALFEWFIDVRTVLKGKT